MCDTNLITTYTFHGRPYLVKMSVVNSSLELILTDKHTGEEWECNYDVPCSPSTQYILLENILTVHFSDIENLTRKTGNFKQFNIFIAMIRSGLLKTSDCICLDLLTYEDLENLRIKRIRPHYHNKPNNCNRRYLIITYSVEFDKINYPLCLEYCGYPDPLVLQDTIRKLESELCKANEQLEIRNHSTEKQRIVMLHNRIDSLTSENKRLNEEVKYLSSIISKGPKSQVQTFQKAITQIEKNLLFERKSHHKLLDKLQNERTYLINQLEKLKISEKVLKNQLQALSRTSSVSDRNNYISKALPKSKPYNPTCDTVFQRKKSPAVKKNKNIKPRQRSRSSSPQIRVEDVWIKFPENIRHSTNTKSRSRSSSMSSTRQSSGYNILGSGDISPAPSGRLSSRRQSPHSGRSSIHSYKTETNKHVTTKLLRSPIQSRSASPELMQKVNKMFPNKRQIKKRF